METKYAVTDASLTAATQISDDAVTSVINNGGIVSAEFRRFFDLVVAVGLAGSVSILGMVTNVLNIMVFKRQGFRDSVNISLTGLAVADFCSVTLMLWYCICMTIYHAHIPPFFFDPLGMLMSTAAWPRLIFFRLSCWLTILITLERCVCVTLPFKVKFIFSPRNTLVLTLSTFVIVIVSHAFVYYVRSVTWTFNSKFNVSQFMIDPEPSESFTTIFTVLFTFLPLVNLCLVIIFTAVLSVKLNMSLKWRTSITSGSVANKATTEQKSGWTTTSYFEEDLRSMETATKAKKDQEKDNSKNKSLGKEARVTKMICTVTTVFIVFTLPSNVVLTACNFVPGFQAIGRYSNLFGCASSFSFLLETITSSINLFIYFSMSSKFKTELMKLFSRN